MTTKKVTKINDINVINIHDVAQEYFNELAKYAAYYNQELYITKDPEALAMALLDTFEKLGIHGCKLELVKK